MKGYFSSLAKQSSVSIRGARASAGPLPHKSMTEPVGPVHSETVLFIDPTPTAVGLVNDAQTIQKATPQTISEHPPALNENANVSSQAPPSISDSWREARTNETEGPVAAAESSFSMTRSLASPAIKRPEDPVPLLVERQVVALEQDAPKKGGVIRVGEFENAIEMKTTVGPASSGEPFRHDVSGATSIPHEYLEGIREWLTSPSIDVAESDRPGTLRQSSERAFVPAKDPDRSTRPGRADPELRPQNEIQEFSLSIGSISIVVEEPAAPKQQANVQPQTVAPVSPAAPAHDAFALSRRYFRGF
jgi:hypothetical protein